MLGVGWWFLDVWREVLDVGWWVWFGECLVVGAWCLVVLAVCVVVCVVSGVFVVKLQSVMV